MKQHHHSGLFAAALCLSVAAAGTGLAYSVTDLLMRYALARERPKPMGFVSRLLSGSMGQDQFLQAVQDADLSLARKKNEAVRIRSKRDGVPLVGHIIAPSDPERVVLAAHGWRSSWTEAFGLLAEFLEGSGCAVLYMEQRGQNNSGGETMGFGLLERYDCVDWANWAQARWPEVPIYLYGISQGATSVLLSAELGLPERVHGLIADCGFTSPKEMWEHFAGETMRLGPLTPLVSALANSCFSRILPGFDAGTSTTDALRNCGVPVLFLHGLEDRFVPAEMTMRNFAACAAPKKLLLVEGADHGMCCFTGKEALEKALREFWDEYDG